MSDKKKQSKTSVVKEDSSAQLGGISKLLNDYYNTTRPVVLATVPTSDTVRVANGGAFEYQDQGIAGASNGVVASALLNAYKSQRPGATKLSDIEKRDAKKSTKPTKQDSNPNKLNQIEMDDARKIAEYYLKNSGNTTTPVTDTASAQLPPTPTITDTGAGGYTYPIVPQGDADAFTIAEPIYQTPIVANPATLRSLDELAKAYGIKYDYNSLYNMFKKSVQEQYHAMYQKQRENEGKYADNAATAQNTLYDTLNAQRSAAVSNGVNRGMQAANALSAALGVSNQFADEATTLAQARGDMAADYGAALAKARIDASAESYNRKQALLETAKVLYGSDVDQYASQLGYNANIGTNNASLYNTYQTNRTNRANTLTEAQAQLGAAGISANAGVRSANIAAQANMYAAQLGAKANMYAADKNNASSTAYYNMMAKQYETGGNGGYGKNYVTAEELQKLIDSGALAVASDKDKDKKVYTQHNFPNGSNTIRFAPLM